MASAMIASTRPVNRSCQRRRPSGSFAGERGHERRSSPRDRRAGAGRSGARRRPRAPGPASRRRPAARGRQGPGRGGDHLGPGIRAGPLVALGDGDARCQTGRIGVLARRSGRRRPRDRAVRGWLRSRPPRRARGWPWSCASRASVLIRLISVSHSRAASSSSVGRRRRPDSRSEAALGGLLRFVDRPRVGAPGGRDGRGLVRVVGPLREAECFERPVGVAPGAGRELAALGGDPPLVGAAVRSRPGPSSSGHERGQRPCRSGSGWPVAFGSWSRAGGIPVNGRAGSMIRPGTGGSEGSGVIGIAPAMDGATAGDLGSANRTVVRRSAPPAGIASPTSRRSAGPPRAGSGPTVTNASSARVVARRGMASCATVTRTSRGEGGRARISSTSAAPETAPRISPRARKLNSLGVTLPASRGSCSFASGAPSSGQRSCE